ncbi:MAG: hypothetical protein WAT79_08525 [Saprospiraceae bacterium]
MSKVKDPQEVESKFKSMISSFIPSEEDGHDKYLDQMDIEELHGVDTDEDFRGSYDD